MAGIGFELRRMLQNNTYFGLLRAYVYAGMISAGPWALSILVVMLVGIFSVISRIDSQQTGAFLVSVTYLVAASLIVSGVVQLVFTRFVADHLYRQRQDLAVPSLAAFLLFLTIFSGVIATLLGLFLFSKTLLLYRLEMYLSFICLCNIWLLTAFLSGLKNYRLVFASFAAGYGCVLVLSLVWQSHGLVGLLGAFCIGQAVLMLSMLAHILYTYPLDKLTAWSSLGLGKIKWSLVAIGLFYNLGIWADKIAFWFNPETSIAVIGPLRASPIYDFPMFLAYLSIIPGMAVFLMRIEADFSLYFSRYYDAIRDGGTFGDIELMRLEMIETVRQSIYDVFKIQGIAIAVLLLLAPQILKLVGLSDFYIPLFNIDIVAVGLQLLLMVVLNFQMYLDRLKSAFGLCLLFVVTNFAFTGLSQWLGAPFYGYGFVFSLALVTMVGLVVLSRQLENLSYDTFMLQAGSS